MMTRTTTRTIRGLLIDLDDTLVDERGASEQAFAAWHTTLGSLPPEHTGDQAHALWKAITNKHWRRHAAGEISFLAQRRERVREFLRQDVSDDEADALFAPYRAAHQNAWALRSDAAAFLQRCAHLPKIIVTNGPRMLQERKLDVTGITAHFIGMVTPDDCGHAKPKPEIFHRALGLIGLAAADCMMIGDDIECDIEPAHALGMASFHVEHGVRDLHQALA